MATIGPGELGKLYDAYCDAMALYARQWLQEDLARDVVQEVFLSLMRQRQWPQGLKAWLFRSVRNGALNALRSQQRRLKRHQAQAAARTEWFQSRVEDLIDARTAHEALASLPPEPREIVMLRLWAGMTFQEIAQTLDLPVSTIFSRYRQAIEAVRKELNVSCNPRNH